jgi:hypothetical protein
MPLEYSLAHGVGPISRVFLWWGEGHGRICGGRRELEVAAGNREVAQRRDARWTTTNRVDV